jgi:hypothetical protein
VNVANNYNSPALNMIQRPLIFGISLQFLLLVRSRRVGWLRRWFIAMNCLRPADEFKAFMERPLDGVLHRFVEYER